MSYPTPHSDEAIVLDQPWQIELYRLHVLKHYCRYKVRGIPTGPVRRSLKSINTEFGWHARTFGAAEILFGELIKKKEAEAGISR